MYEYTALTESHSIRVLELQPAWKRGADLVIRLLEVSIDKPPNFEALSYAWESQELDQRIMCDGDTLLISVTCKAALVRLRRKIRPRLLWIDQICINQTSSKEKNHQVAIMGEIYSRAKMTIVWLGDGPENDKVLRGTQELRFFNLCCRLPILRRILTPRYGAILKERHFYSSSPIIWFNRIWTVQEVALARQARVFTSRREMDYDSFVHNWTFLNWGYVQLADLVERCDTIAGVIVARASARAIIRSKRLKNPEGYGRGKQDARSVFPLGLLRGNAEPMRILCGVTAAASSHPSDKVFAIYGVMKELGVSLAEPDYGMDTGEVYWKACVALMARTCSLNPLILVNGIHWSSKFPSWVPDFNETHRRIIATSALFVDEFWTIPSHDTKAQFKLINGNRIITTKTKLIDLVQGKIYQQTEIQSIRPGKVSLEVANLVRENLHAIHCFQSWILASEMHEDFTLENEDNFAAFVEVMFIRNTPFTPPGAREDENRLIRLLWISAHDQEAIYIMFSKAIEDSSMKGIILSTSDFTNLLHLPEAQLLGLIECEGLMESFDRMKAVAEGSAFFWTKDGHIGIGPQAVAVGDMVALIAGINIPMILRPTKASTYQVIGPAYKSRSIDWGQLKTRGTLLWFESILVAESPPVDHDWCDIFLV